MKNYCSICGKKLVNRPIGDELNVYYCIDCNKSYYDNPISSVLVAVLNPKNQIILLKQHYVSKGNWVLVAGYLSLGENLEECAKREVFEETGLTVNNIEYINSYYFEKKELIMAGFLAYTNDFNFNDESLEVDDLAWFSIEDALNILKDGSIAETHLINVIKHRKNKS